MSSSSLLLGALLIISATSSPTPPGTDPDRHCGEKLTDHQPTKGSFRIFGGQDADLHEWRWQVALREKELDFNQTCGGTLISNQWVITAAHCVTGIIITDLFAGLGEHNINKLKESETRVGIKRVEIHPDYYITPIYGENDLALLELEPYTPDAVIHPVCLPTKHLDSAFAGEKGTVTGWGTTSYGGPSSEPEILQEVELPIITNNKCANEYSGEATITDKMICTYAPGADACRGDSGGPLVWQTPSGHYNLVGVVAWGKGCAEVGSPGVYTRVTQYLPWINYITGQAFPEP